jgi:SAM-dependent methyltransferase
MNAIERNLPPAPARVLDAGCGDGTLAEGLRAKGYTVTAIDIDPSLASPSVQVADICTYEDQPFDAVIFSLSLHHVHDLARAVKQSRHLLAPAGLVIVDEFAWERADDTVADVFYGEPGSLRRWREHHRELHAGHTMIEAISAHFRVRSLRNAPYLHRYLEDDTLLHIESTLGFQLTATPDYVAGPQDSCPVERSVS